MRKQKVVSNPGSDDVCLLLIHSDVIIVAQCIIVSHLERPWVVDHELLVSTCPKWVQNEYMGEKTECGVQPGLR